MNKLGCKNTVLSLLIIWLPRVVLTSSRPHVLTSSVLCLSLFARAPGATAQYKRLNVDDFEGPAFSGHIMRVMSGLDMLINYLDSRPTLEKLLSHMADQHAVYAGVTSGAFDVSSKNGTNIRFVFEISNIRTFCRYSIRKNVFSLINSIRKFAAI